jgi:putative DNA primase/helicase
VAIIPTIPDGPPRDRQWSSAPYETQIITAMVANGVTPPSHILMDGQLRRWGDGTTKGKKPYWYCIFGDGHPSGTFGDWRVHGPEGIKWVAESTDSGASLTPEERSEIDARIKVREAQKVKDQAGMASVCATIWRHTLPAPEDHLYLIAKKIKPHGARVSGDRLVLPIFNADGKIISLQYIDGEGEKKYKTGGAISGGMWMVGEWGDGTIYIAEGFATAASIHEATGECCIVAYTASNLVPVAGAVRGIAGVAGRIVIVADNDESGTGEKWARKAEAAYGVDVVVMPAGDANDFVCAGGDLIALLARQPGPDPAPKLKKQWLESLDDLLQDQSPIRWIIKNWLQENTLIMVHGPASSGKTFLTLDFCCHVAVGAPWAGHKVNQGGVAYLAGEGNYGVRQRAAAWAQEHGVKKFGHFVVSKSGCDLDTKDGRDTAIKYLDAIDFKPKIIVIDTLHRFLSGDEDSARDAKKMVDACEFLMDRYQCTVILVHHTGNDARSQSRPRGSSAWTGDVGMRISMTPGKTIKEPITISMLKAKDSEPAAPKSMLLKKIEIEGWLDDDGEQVSSLVPVISTGIETVVLEKIDKKLEGFKQDFLDAWQWSGGESRGSKPYLTKAGMERFLHTQRAEPESTARLHASGTKEGHIINYLIANRIIKNLEDGWIVIDGGLGMICLMIMKDKKLNTTKEEMKS